LRSSRRGSWRPADSRFDWARSGLALDSCAERAASRFLASRSCADAGAETRVAAARRAAVRAKRLRVIIPIDQASPLPAPRVDFPNNFDDFSPYVTATGQPAAIAEL